MPWNPSATLAVGDKVPVAFGQAFGPWTGYTPTLGGWTLGNGTVGGSYCQIDNLVFFRAFFAFGSTSAAAAAAPTLTLPVTASANQNLLGQLGHGTFYDAGVNTYQAIVRLNSTTTIGLYIPGASGIHTTPSTTTPHTWGNGDTVLAFGMYEAA